MVSESGKLDGRVIDEPCEVAQYLIRSILLLGGSMLFFLIVLIKTSHAQSFSCNICECSSCDEEKPGRIDECTTIDFFEDGNLWKPTGDGRANGVFLSKGSYVEPFDTCQAQRKKSNEWEDLEYTGKANPDQYGLRQHWRFSATGSKYKGVRQEGYVRCRIRDQFICFPLDRGSGVRNE